PIRPPRASISLTRLPLARPPMAGLHDMRPIASRSIVTRATRAPPRAATRAASAPACPPPMTTMSNRCSIRSTWNTAAGCLFPDAELREDLGQDLVVGDRAGQQAERIRRPVEIDDDDRLFVPGIQGVQSGGQSFFAGSDRLTLPLVHDRC